jgi:endonuclease YncB( thermonuclease family)
MTQHPEQVAYILFGSWVLFQLYCIFVCPHKVIDANDGDGIKIRYRLIQFWITVEQKIRLALCDAPETKGNQPWGYEAKEFLKKLVIGRPVRLVEVGRNQDRIVCKVYLYGFFSVSWWMVLTGNAENYPEYGGRYYWEQWLAQVLRLGMWKNGTRGVIRPSVWREQMKKKQEGQADKVVKMPVKKKVKRK